MHYRLYALSDSRKIMNGQDIAAETDAEAIRIGRETHPQAPFELWCQARRVFTCGKSSASGNLG